MNKIIFSLVQEPVRRCDFSDYQANRIYDQPLVTMSDLLFRNKAKPSSVPSTLAGKPMPDTVPEATLKVLHLEDDLNDQQLVEKMLASEGLSLDIQHAKSRKEFEAALCRADFDLILSDFTLPSYDGKAALLLARKTQPDAAFIFFSGTIGEETAVESLKTGATDYVLKQRPHRLASAVRRAIEETRERRKRQAAETALRESEERFRIVAQAMKDVIWDWNLQTGEVWLNENFSLVFGHSKSASNPLSTWRDLLHENDSERVLASLSETIAAGSRFWDCEYRFRRADGAYAYVFDRAFVMYNQQGKPERMIGVMIDMTGRKQAEEKIREQAALLQKAQDAVIVCDLADRVMFWNPSAERIYGWSAAEALGRPVVEMLYHENPAQFEETRNSVLRRGEWQGELRQTDRHDRPVIVQSSCTLVRDDDGRPTSKLMINTDLTAKRQLEEQLIRAQRLESLGVLVAGITHDLNNSLTPILMGTRVLGTMDLPKEAADILKSIESSARRGADMVSQVMTFARGGSAMMGPVRVDQLARELGWIIKDIFPKSIHCRITTQPDSWQITGAATQIHQVLMNLAINARDAMERGGELVISTKNIELTATDVAGKPGRRVGRHLCLSVADTGPGIPPEKLSRIFEPFFTTKAPGKGTGLGLPTSQTIVQNHGGFITVESTVGQGTEFKIFLPANVEIRAGIPTSSVMLPAGRGESILVVDDEVAVLAVMKASLENYNYRVFTAASGPEAIACFSEQQDQIKLVITDMVMPFMDGAATIEALRKLRPDVRVIAASGLDQEHNALSTQAHPHAYLRKPFTAEKLLLTTHRILTQPG